MATAFSPSTSTMNPIQLSSARDEYDALRWPVIDPTTTTSRHAKHLATVIHWIRGQASFTGTDRFDYTAVNVDPYSISIKHEAVLYQYRETSAGWKGHPNIRKTYYLAQWSKTSKSHVVETEIHAAKARAAVRLFPDDPAGAVEYLLGVRAKPPAKPQPPIRGFKLVRVRLDATGEPHYFSYFDGTTEYVLGQTTHETAKAGHRGGLYCYLSQEFCEPANIAVGSYAHIERGEGLAILEVVGSGKKIRYDRAGKYAVSHLTPVRVVSLVRQPAE